MDGILQSALGAFDNGSNDALLMARAVELFATASGWRETEFFASHIKV